MPTILFLLLYYTKQIFSKTIETALIIATRGTLLSPSYRITNHYIEYPYLFIYIKEPSSPLWPDRPTLVPPVTSCSYYLSPRRTRYTPPYNILWPPEPPPPWTEYQLSGYRRALSHQSFSLSWGQMVTVINPRTQHIINISQEIINYIYNHSHLWSHTPSDDVARLAGDNLQQIDGSGEIVYNSL